MKRDKVWFWASFRINDVANEAPVFVNKNAFNPNAWLYDPDTSQPGVNQGEQLNTSVRRDLAGQRQEQDRRHLQGRQVVQLPEPDERHHAPEAARDRRFPRLRQEHAEWTSPVTNKLLIEVVGMHLFERWGDMHLRLHRSITDQGSDPVADDRGDRAEHRPELPRPRAVYNNTAVPSLASAAAAYVTGSHAMKVGWNRTTASSTSRCTN